MKFKSVWAAIKQNFIFLKVF